MVRAHTNGTFVRRFMMTDFFNVRRIYVHILIREITHIVHQKRSPFSVMSPLAASEHK